MKGINAKLFLLQPTTLHKQPSGSAPPLAAHHRLYLIVFLTFFTCASLLTLLSTTHLQPPPPQPTTTVTAGAALPTHVFDTLLHYAAASNASGRMPDAELRTIAAVLRRRAPANLLVFGLTHETPLWRALNAGGRTVFLDENEYYIAHLEGRHPGLEGYDVSYTTHVRDLHDLLGSARAAATAECRPVQNLLYSDCKLAINDLPNSLYDVAWDVILVDGPRGYDGAAPGRMAAIFTAAVMARTRNGAPTEVLVHDYEREVERVCSEEFLCGENMVVESSNAKLAHFVIRAGGGTGGRFCSGGAGAASSAKSQ